LGKARQTMAASLLQVAGPFASDLDINSPLPAMVSLSESNSAASPTQSVDAPVGQKVVISGGRLPGPSRWSVATTTQATPGPTPASSRRPSLSPNRVEPARATVSPTVSPSNSSLEARAEKLPELLSTVVNLPSARKESGEVTPQLFFRPSQEQATLISSVNEVVSPPTVIGQTTVAKDLFSVPALNQQLPPEPAVNVFIRNNGTTLPAATVTTVPASSVSIPELRVSQTPVDNGLRAQDVEALMLAERSRIFMAVQDIIGNQLRIHTEAMNQEFSRIVNMINAVSGACDERLVRMDVDLAARATVLQGVKRDLDGHQSQIRELFHAKAQAPAGYNEQREEIILMIDQVSKEVRQQYRNFMTGLSAHKESHERHDQAIADMRREHRNEVNASLERQADLRDELLAIQARAEKQIADLRGQVSQSLQVVRGDILAEMESFRGLGGLSDRLAAAEGRTEELHRALLDLNIGELTRLIRNEGSARLELQRDLEALRAANIQSAHEIRTDQDVLRESLQRPRVGQSEDRNLRERVLTTERSLAEVRAIASSLKSAHIGSREPMLAKDIQDLSRQIGEESSARLQIGQSLDAYRSAYLNTTTELRAELDVALERLARLEFRCAEPNKR